MEGLGNQQVKEKKPRNIVLQERDKVVIQWLSRVGIASSDQIASMFGYSVAPILRRLQKLRQAGKVDGKKIDTSYPVVFWSKIGYFDLPVKQPNPGTFEHDYTLTGLYIWLVQQYPGRAITTDRELRRDQGVGRLIGERGKRLHLPDGILELENERIAVELENSVKSKDRLQAIFRQYYADHNIDQVWYFATCAGVRNVIANNAVNGNKIKLFAYPGGAKIPIRGKSEGGTDQLGQTSMYDFALKEGRCNG
jgi:DNA-binding Lrp family transcriptional regulator